MRLPRTRGRLTAVLAAGAMVLSGAEAQAADLNILPLGDSLTYGLDATDNPNNDLGYRLTLQQFLFNDGIDYDMLGGFGPGVQSPHDMPTPPYTGVTTISNGMGGSRAVDLDHFGWSGAKADDTNGNRALGPALRGTSTHPSLDFDAGFAGQDVNPYGGLLSDPTPPPAANVVLLHIGTNQVDNPGLVGSGGVFDPLRQLDTLRDALQADLEAGRIADDARIVIADIVPRASNGRFELVDETFNYNAGIDSEIAKQSLAFQDRVQRVSMFDIEITQDLLDQLGLADDSLLDVDDDNFVDWVTGNYNESTNTGGIDGINLNLFNPDGIHLTQLGYDVMAYQWYQAIPEPGSLALLALGGLALAARRRR